MIRLGVCGLGKLGSPIAAVFAEAGVPVVGYDINGDKVRAIQRGEPPVDEPNLDAMIKAAGDNLTAVSHLTEMVERTDACILVTPTPSEPNGDFDHGYLRAALIKISSKVEQMKKRDYGFIVASTVMPGFMATEATSILRNTLSELGYRLAYKPEFIALGTVIENLRDPDVLLIGAEDVETQLFVAGLYAHVISGRTQVKMMSLTEAELTKISLNCAVTMRISFANQVALVARSLGVDARKVLDAVGADHRIGSATLRPGLPFGGPCFPRDNRMFSRVADRVGTYAPLASAVDSINAMIIKRMVDDIPERGDVGILGLAYKPGTPITEESAGVKLKEILTLRGRTVKAHDVQAPHSDSLAEVLACDTVIVACDWPEYRGLKVVKPGTKIIDPYNVLESLSGCDLPEPVTLTPSDSRVDTPAIPVDLTSKEP